MNNSLRSETMEAQLDAAGRLTRIANRLTAEDVPLDPAGIKVAFDRLELDQSSLNPVQRKNGARSIALVYQKGPCQWVITYSFAPGAGALNVVWTVTNQSNQRLTLTGMTLAQIKPKRKIPERVPYYAYRCCPVAVFLRLKKGGFAVGVESPWITLEPLAGNGIGFKCKLPYQIEPGEKFTSDPVFILPYKNTDRFTCRELPVPGTGLVPRLPLLTGPNPCNAILDLGEVRAMRAYLNQYCRLRPPHVTIFYNCYTGATVIHRHIQNGQLDDFLRQLLDHLDRFGADIISTYVSYRYKATLDQEEIDLCREWTQLGHPGIFMFTAGPERIYMPDCPESWGIRQADGTAARYDGPKGWGQAFPEVYGRQPQSYQSNCLGHKPYMDFYVQALEKIFKNTRIASAGFDGSAYIFDSRCHSPEHTHPAGDSRLHAYRNYLDYCRQMRARHPKVVMYQGWGVKRGGPWALRYIDGDEEIYEQTCSHGYVLPNLHEDMLNADVGRMSHWYQQNDRFLPHPTNWALCFHYGMGYFWDEFGWKYSLLTALGYAALISPLCMPREPGKLVSRDFFEFSRKWIDWAKKHAGILSQNYRGLFGPPAIGRVDGVAHIDGKQGIIFIFNPNHVTKSASIPLDDQIGLTEAGHYLIQELHPYECCHYGPHTGLYRQGDEFHVNVLPQCAMILEIKPATSARLKQPVVFGLSGKVALKGTRLTITGAGAEQGCEKAFAVRLPAGARISALTVNGSNVPFRQSGGMLRARIRFAGTPIIRELARLRWTDARGQTVRIPNPAIMEQPVLRTSFILSPEVKEKLARQKRAEVPVPPIREPGMNWGEIEFTSTSNGKLNAVYPSPWLMTDRLLLALPLAYPGMIREIGVRLNCREVPIKIYRIGTDLGNPKIVSFYADLTEAVKWGEPNDLELRFDHLEREQLLGPYLEHIPERLVKVVEPLNAPRNIVFKAHASLQPAFPGKPAIHKVVQECRRAEKIRAVMLQAEERLLRKFQQGNVAFGRGGGFETMAYSRRLCDGNLTYAPHFFRMPAPKDQPQCVGISLATPLGATTRINKVRIYNAGTGVTRTVRVKLLRQKKDPAPVLAGEHCFGQGDNAIHEFEFEPCEAAAVTLEFPDAWPGGDGEITLREAEVLATDYNEPYETWSLVDKVKLAEPEKLDEFGEDALLVMG